MNNSTSRSVSLFTDSIFQKKGKQGLALLAALSIPLGWSAPAVALENVDFGSTQPDNIAAQSANLRVGGKIQTVKAGTLITDAQMAALQQVTNTGRQQLILGEGGNATGGRVNLTTDVLAGINNLAIPRGVTAVNDFGRTAMVSIAGSLTNSGRLVAYTSNAATTQNVFNFQSLTNLQTGLITNSLAGITGIAGIRKAMDLNLNVLGDFINYGKINSTGALNISAGGSIMNLTAASQTVPATLSAVSGITLASSAITNSGTIQTTRGNINILSPGTDLLFANAGGVVRAPSGVINFRDANFNLKEDLNLLGGDLIAKALNFYSGDGTVNVDIEKVIGRVNVYGGIAHVTAASPTLHLGDIVLTGDPTFYNTAGDVVLDGNFILAGQDLAIVAGGDILSGANGGQIATGQAGGKGGEINLIAGAQFTSTGGTFVLPPTGDTTSTITITGGSTIGGKIDLTLGTPITSVSSGTSGGNAGNINIVAFKGTNLNSGTIKLPNTAGAQVNTAANGGNAGDINIIAGASSGTTIQVGIVSAQLLTNNTPGDILIATKTPDVGSGITILNGKITSGAFGTAALQSGSITTNTIINTAGSVTIESGGNVAITSGVNVSAGFPTGAGSLSVSTKSSSPLNVGSVSGSNFIQTVIGIAQNGNGAKLAFSNSGSGGVTAAQGLIADAAVTGKGGSILLDATSNGGTGDVILGQNFYGARGVNGDGGSITIKSTNSISNSIGLVQLNASSLSGTGNGGSISVSTTSAFGDIQLKANTANNLSLAANGGPTAGNGGTITLDAGRDILVTNAGLSKFMQAVPIPAGTGGAGGNYNLTARNVLITGSIDANSVGTFKGGTVVVSTNSSTPFTTSGIPGINGTTSGISAQGTNTGLGSVTILNKGSGGINHVNSSGINVSPAGLGGKGGTIVLDATQSGGTGPINLGTGVTISANAFGAGANDGGFVALRGSTITGLGGAATISANGTNTGKGGQIEITSTDPGSSIVVGATSGAISLSATAANGNGGSVTVNSGQDIFVNTGTLLVRPTTSGSGGQITLNAGRSVSLQGGSLNASANGTGNGGSITINTNSSSPFTTASTLSPNGASNPLLAQAQTNGSGGSITITNRGTGGIVYTNAVNDLQIGPVGNGNGGSLTLDTASNGGSGTVSIGNFTLTASASGTGSTAGSLTIKGTNILTPGLFLAATGGTTGSGGKVTLATTDPSVDFTVGAFPFGLNVSGGTTSGSAGEINVSSARDLSVTPGASFVFTANNPGNGAKISLSAGRNLDVSAGLNVNAAGTGNGGSVSLTSNSPTVFTINGGATNRINGLISAIAATNGSQGSISVINLGSGGIFLNALSLNASGAGNAGNTPGSIVLNGASISGSGNATINGGTNGIGGNISITSTSNASDIVIPGIISLSAGGGTTSGAGGSITVKSGRDLLITDASQLFVTPVNGSGGHLDLEAGRNLVVSNNNLFAASNGTGSGGSIRLVSNSSTPFAIGANNGVNFVINTMLAQGKGATGDGGKIEIINTGSGGIAYQTNGFFTNVAAATSGKGGTVILDSPNGSLLLGSNTVNLTLNADGTGTGAGGEIHISAFDIILGSQQVQLDAGSLVSGGIVTVTSTSPTANIALQTFLGIGIDISGGTDAGTLVVSSGHNISAISNIISSAGSGKGANITLTAGTAGSGNLQIGGTGLSANGGGNGDGGQIQLNFRDPSGIFGVGLPTAGSFAATLNAKGAGTGKGGTISITNTAGTGINLSVDSSPLSTTGSSTGFLNLFGGSGPVGINGSGFILLANVNATGSTFTYSNDADVPLLVNNVSVTGAINITNSGPSDTRLSISNGGILSSGSDITVSVIKLINNGTISAGGTIFVSAPVKGLTVSGLGHAEAGGAISYISSGSLAFTGSQTYSVPTNSFVNFNGTSILLDTGVTQNVLSDSFLNLSAPSLILNRSSKIVSAATVPGNNISVNGSPNLAITIQDTFSSTISTAGAPINFFTSGFLSSNSIGATSTGTLLLSGGPVTMTAGNFNNNQLSTISATTAITILPGAFFTNNGTISTSAAGNSIQIQGTGNLTLSGGVGKFSMTSASASITSISSTTGIKLSNSLGYTLSGPNATLVLDAPAFDVSGAATSTASLTTTNGVTFKNSVGSNAVTFANTTGTATLNVSGGDIFTTGGSVKVPSGFTLAQPGGGKQHFNIPDDGVFTNNGNLATITGGIATIDIQGAGNLTIAGKGTYQPSGVNAQLSINAAGNISIPGTINSASSVLIQSSGSSTIDGSSGLVSGPGKALTVNAGSGSVTLNTDVATVSLTGTGNIGIFNSNDLALSSLTGTPTDLTLEADGKLDINAAINAGKVSLAANGAMTLNQNVSGTNFIKLSNSATNNIGGTGIVSGGKLIILYDGAGDVQLTTAVTEFTIGGTASTNVSLVQSGDISMPDDSLLGDLTIKTGAGDDISFGASLKANNLSLNTTGTSSITGKGQLTVASTIDLDLDTGSVDINTDASTLTISSNGAAVSINETDSITLNGINAGSFNLTALAVTNSAPLVADDVTIQTPSLTNAASIISDTTIVSSTGSLSINGIGFWDSLFTVNLTAATGDLSFGGNQVIDAIANLNAVNPGQSVTVQNGVTVEGEQLVNVNSSSLVLVGTGTIIGNPLRLNSVTGAGTIANASGDLTLSSNLVFDGKNLSILASGNVLATSAAKQITLSSKTTSGGSLFIAAGHDFTPAPFPAAPGFSPQTFTLGGPSATGGSVLLPNVTINTSTTSAAKAGGNVIVITNAGPSNAGSIALGAITTSASTGVGGDVKLYGQGGVQTGKITTTGGSAGNVSIRGEQPIVFGGSIQIVNGTALGTGLLDTLPAASGTGAAVFVNGAILANSLIGAGGNVDIFADAQIETAGNILTSGATRSGDLTILSSDSFVSVGKGGINTSGVQVSSVAAAATAGDVFIVAPAGIAVNGSLLATGGSNKGTGNAGDGGSVELATTDSNPANLFINNIKIAGLLDTRGGSALAGGGGGGGGDIDINAGTLQVSQANISINASAGTGIGAPLNGLVTINTYASQSFPSNFDLTSSKKAIPALAGGMFTVGIASPVNGTAGNIVSGNASVASKTNAARIVAGPGFTSPSVTIQVTGTGKTITENSVGVPISIDNGIGTRTLVTPGEAVALFQVARGSAQSIKLNATGQAEATSVIDVQNFELPQPFTAFKLAAVNAPTNDIKLNVFGLRPIVSLPASAVLIQGTLEFEPGSVGMLDFGKGAVNIPSNATISGDTLIISSASGTWSNAGLIQAAQIILSHPASSPLVLTNLPGGSFAGTALDSSLMLSYGYIPTYVATFKANGASFNLPVEFGTVPLPTAYKASAQNHALTASALRPVAVSFALTGPLNVPLTGTVQGTPVNASTITISSTKNTVNGVSTNTALKIGDDTLLNANTTMKITSASTLTIGDNVDLIAGVLKPTASPTGLLNPSDIAKAGSIAITAPSITLGSHGSMVANGGNVSVTASTGNLAMGDNGVYQSNGGQIFILANGTVAGGAGNSFYARGTNVSSSKGGTIEIGSGTTKANTFASVFKLPKGSTPVAGTLGSGVTINNAGTGAVATTITGGLVNLRSGGLAPATLNLTGGAMLFEALGSGTGKSVQFDGVIMKTESLKLISYTETKDPVTLREGTTLVHMIEDTTIYSGGAEIKARKGALLNLSMESGVLRVTACSGPAALRVTAEGLQLALPPGSELVLGSDLSEDDIHPADGTGRRDTVIHKLPSGKKLAVQEVSLITLLSNSDHLSALRKPTTPQARRFQSQILKTAAALQHVQARKGPFTGRHQQAKMEEKKEEFRPVAYR